MLSSVKYSEFQLQARSGEKCCGSLCIPDPHLSHSPGIMLGQGGRRFPNTNELVYEPETVGIGFGFRFYLVHHGIKLFTRTLVIGFLGFWFVMGK